jgi:hypothetical protein
LTGNPPSISIAEAVGDPRVRKNRCYVCKKTYFLEAHRGARRKFCPDCSLPWAKQQRAASSIVKIAIRAGFLPSIAGQKCVDCGEPATGYEHREYRRALDVDPICTSCNFRRGPAKGATC